MPLLLGTPGANSSFEELDGDRTSGCRVDLGPIPHPGPVPKPSDLDREVLYRLDGGHVSVLN